MDTLYKKLFSYIEHSCMERVFTLTWTNQQVPCDILTILIKNFLIQTLPHRASV